MMVKMHTIFACRSQIFLKKIAIC